MIIDWIDTTPSKINISNVFVLDRRLLLSVSLSYHLDQQHWRMHGYGQFPLKSDASG